MPSWRLKHIEESVKREIVAIIRELEDPRVRDNFVNVIKTNISKDSSYCSVYISSILGIEKAREAVKGLESASGYIKCLIGQRLDLRRVPHIKFYATDFVEQGIDMMKKIRDLGDESKKMVENDINVAEESL